MAGSGQRLRHKHLKLDQAKIDVARRFFGARTEQEAIDRALEAVVAEAAIRRTLESLGGVGGFEDPWR